MYFFDSTEDDERIYQAADFARFHNQIIGSGVSNTKELPDLEVTAKNNMDVGLGAGYMFANGYMYELTETMNLKHDVADPDNDRIDRVVIRFDNNPENREIKAVIKKGTPAGSPTPPSLTRDNYIYEMSVAQVRIKAGKSYVEDDEITDERSNDSVCGYIPLHNIYRALSVDENGLTSFVNQSFIKTKNEDVQTFQGGTTLDNPTPLRLGKTEADNQKEISSGTSIKVKSDGVYSLFVQLNFNQPSVSRVYVYVFVNGKHSFPLGMKTVEGDDRMLMASGFDYLDKNDEITFMITASGGSSTTLETVFTRARIAKVS